MVVVAVGFEMLRLVRLLGWNAPGLESTLHSNKLGPRGVGAGRILSVAITEIIFVRLENSF
jgi:hypothetical protein